MSLLAFKKLNAIKLLFKINSIWRFAQKSIFDVPLKHRVFQMEKICFFNFD